MDLELEINKLRLLYQTLKDLQEQEQENTKKKIQLELQHLQYQHTYQRLRVKITLNNYEQLLKSEKNLKITLNSQEIKKEKKEEIVPVQITSLEELPSNINSKREPKRKLNSFRLFFKKECHKKS